METLKIPSQARKPEIGRNSFRTWAQPVRPPIHLRSDRSCEGNSVLSKLRQFSLFHSLVPNLGVNIIMSLLSSMRLDPPPPIEWEREEERERAKNGWVEDMRWRSGQGWGMSRMMDKRQRCGRGVGWREQRLRSDGGTQKKWRYKVNGANRGSLLERVFPDGQNLFLRAVAPRCLWRSIISRAGSLTAQENRSS